MTYSVPLLSATLGADDVVIAETWLQKTNYADQALVQMWEQTFANWLGVETATAWMGGRASLYAAIHALQLQPGDEVILPAFTCQCVVNAFLYHKIGIRYADIELQTYGMDVASAANMITPQTKAILLQYTFGLVSRDTAALLRLAKARNLYVIEDCAHALGASWQGKKLGTLGDIAIFSTERSKIINTIHGGLVATNQRTLGERLKALAADAPMPGQEKTRRLLNTVIQNYHFYVAENRVKVWGTPEETLPQMFPEEFAGIFTPHYTERINAPVAALALNQFAKMAQFHPRRMAAARYWDQWCQENGYQPPVVIADSVPAFLRYPVCVPAAQKQDLRWIENALNITAGVWFTSAAHPQPLTLAHCPVGAKAASECINLPTLLPDHWFA
jgi:dTDP-4-amino-4,6-dideoxygalactose transaminase